MTSLFEETFNEPLPSRLRPDNLDEFVGQTHLVGKGKILRRLIETDSISSMIFWGPPGVGKTTLARIIASHTHSSFIDFSAVTSGIKEIREVMKQAENNRVFGEKTILFVDEIHRFNKSQQDAFLPFVEKGSIILIGATTENPSFEINGALLSRCKVFVLNALEEEDIVSLLKHAISSPKGFGNLNIDISDDCLHLIASFSNGDARNALLIIVMSRMASFMLLRPLLNNVHKRNLFYMIRRVRNIIISLVPYINQCVIQIQMPLYIGLLECWRREKILFMSQEE